MGRGSPPWLGTTHQVVSGAMSMPHMVGCLSLKMPRTIFYAREAGKTWAHASCQLWLGANLYDKTHSMPTRKDIRFTQQRGILFASCVAARNVFASPNTRRPQ